MAETGTPEFRELDGGRPEDYDRGPFLCRVHREVVGGALVRVTLEPIAPEQTVELGRSGGDEFITVMAKRELAPLSAWEK